MGGGGPVEGVAGGGAGHAAGGAGGAAWGKFLHGCFSALHAVHALLKRAALCCLCAEITSAAPQAMMQAVHWAEVDRAALGRPGTLWLVRFARF